MNYLLKIIDKVHDYPCPYGIGGTAWSAIRKCIEKQIPQKPKDHPFSDGQCPSCNAVFDYDWKPKPEYCQNCGQKLDWSDKT